MRILSYEFEGHALDVRRNLDGSVATYVHRTPPERRLNRNGSGPFVRVIVTGKLPSSPGVYVVTINRTVVYVGRARTTIKDRWGSNGYSTIHRRNTFSDGQSTNCRINHLLGKAIATGAIVELWTHVTAEPDQVEIELERALRPEWNVKRL